MAKDKDKNIHKGHRNRMRNRFLKVGLDGFDEHEILEFILFHALSRVDTNALSHQLISRFGSLDAVFKAPINELESVNGIGPNCAVLIKFFAQLREKDISSIKSKTPLDTSEHTDAYVRPLFTDMSVENVFVVALDEKLRPICNLKVAEGGFDNVVVSPAKIARFLLASGAANAILAHNHPHGVAVPSVSDVRATNIIKRALDSVEIKLVDHVIVVKDDFTSFRDSGPNLYTTVD